MSEADPRRRWTVLGAGTLLALVAGLCAVSPPTTAPAGATTRPDRAAAGAENGAELHPDALPDATAPADASAPTAIARPVVARTPSGSPRPATAEDPAEDGPLRVVIDRLRPAVVPTEGDLVVTGSVTNVSESRWVDNKVYLLTSVDPMTTDAEIDAAVASDPDIEIGDRLIAPGLFQLVPDLDPGDSTRFRLTVPARRLMVSGEPGVYWLGVHVLGTGDTGRIEGADGRARTLLPLVPDQASTRLALGMPFRRHVVRTSDGTLLYDKLWAAQLRSGRLERARAFAASALPDGRADTPRAQADRPQRERGTDRDRASGEQGRSRDNGVDLDSPVADDSTDSAAGAASADRADGWPLTWLVDGAVLDAADSLAGGNPAVDLASDGSNEVTAPDDEPSEEETAARAAEDDPAARAATRWLDRFVADARDASVLALPYGDLDVSAAADGTDGAALVSLALSESQGVLSQRGVSSAPVVAPPSGYLSPEGLAVLDPDLRVLLGRAALPSDLEDAEDPTVFAAPRGGALATTPGLEGVVGPGPGRTQGALAVRQRLLAEAAVHALSDDADRPLVTVLPALWDPGRDWERADFFAGLQQPWLDGVSLSSVVDPASIGSVTVRGDDLVYPEEEVLAEVPVYAVASTAGLVDRSLTLTDLLTDDAGTGERLDRQALLTSSVWSRAFPGVATERAREAVERVDDWLSRVTIRGPSFITMSSESGTFQVTLVNGLDQAVTVGLSATVRGGPLQLTTPDPVDLPAGGRRPMRIEADATDIGVHQVTLQPVSETGRALGETSTLSVRSSKVGLILWFIIAGGGVALFGAITVRTVRRVLAHRRRRSSGAAA